MGRSIISYYNRVAEDAPVITSSTSATGYPAANAALNDHVRVWRTLTVAGEKSWKVDFGTAKAINFAFGPRFHNLQTGATVAIQGNDADDWGDPTVNELITVTAGKAACKSFAGGSLRWWRWTITDETNPDGYIEIPLFWLGEWQDLGMAFGDEGGYLRRPVVAGRGAASTILTRVGSRIGPVVYEFELPWKFKDSDRAIWEAAMAYAATDPIVLALNRDDLDDTTYLVDWLGVHLGSMQGRGELVLRKRTDGGDDSLSETTMIFSECGAGVDQ